MWKRAFIVILSGWVLFSGYLLPHSRAGLLNSWFVGLGLLVFGALSMAHDWARYVTLLLGVWLFAFTAFAGSAATTFWNSAMVGLLISILSLVGEKLQAPARRSAAHRRMV